MLQESSTWADKGMALSSPTDQHSLGSSGAEAEEEGDEHGRPREFATGSSDDDDEGVSISERRKHKNQHRSGNIAGKVTPGVSGMGAGVASMSPERI